MTLEAIKYSSGKLQILDQLLLPHQSKYIQVKNTADGWTVIKKMQVRGAPAIGVVGALSLAVELRRMEFSSLDNLVKHITTRLNFLVTARPTAVNMADACHKLTELAKSLAAAKDATVKQVKDAMIAEMEKMFHDDVTVNKTMAKFGCDDILGKCEEKSVVLTHCNTGSLATGGYGTALGVVRSLHERERLQHCYCTETRPYNQGSRLTAYELVFDKIPSTLICDSMAAMLMKDKGVNAVLVGADRVVSNGDTANKIGTYQLAIVAKHHGIPFYVVAPSSSIDLDLKTGSDIIIEERPPQEMTTFMGRPTAAKGIGVWNPAFDVTPAELITGGIVTEFGVFAPQDLSAKLQPLLAQARCGK